MTRKNRPFWSFLILTRAKKTDFGDLWWSWVWKSLMKGNSAAFLYYLVLIWTKHSKAIVPQKTTTIIFAPRVNNWFWRRLICIHYTYVAYICCLNHGSWLFFMCVSLWMTQWWQNSWGVAPNSSTGSCCSQPCWRSSWSSWWFTGPRSDGVAIGRKHREQGVFAKDLCHLCWNAATIALMSKLGQSTLPVPAVGLLL